VFCKETLQLKLLFVAGGRKSDSGPQRRRRCGQSRRVRWSSLLSADSFSSCQEVCASLPFYYSCDNNKMMIMLLLGSLCY